MSIGSKFTGLLSLVLLGSLSAAPALAQGSPYGIAGGATPFGGAVNPYVAMTAGGGGSNPYASVGGGGPGAGGVSAMYYGSGNGGLFGREGGILYGAAQVISAYGQALNAQEQSRIMREQYYQAALETQRRRFDLQMYIAARTPSFSEVQQNISKNTLRRIQNNAAPSEIASGKALNLLLDDASKFPGKGKGLDAITLAPEVLKQLNITKQGNGIGLLRNDGKINWPVALADVLTADQRKSMSLEAQKIVKDAAKGQFDANVFKDLRTSINVTRDQLLKRVNDLPGEQYMQAKRFLTDLEASLQAVQQGEAEVQANFDTFIGGKAKNVQDVVDFMTTSGYRFAPGSQGDEASYRALYSALVNYDVALNSQYNPEPPREKEP